jgi:hypothetical protein
LILTVNPLTSSLFGGAAASVPLADFGSFYASGQALGRGLDPYGVYPLTLDAALGPAGAAVNLNPPISLPVFQFMTLLDPVAARRWWFLVTLVSYGVIVGLLMWTYPRFRGPLVIAWALLFTPFVETLLLGQVYAALALLATVGWLALQRGRHGVAGVPIGFVVSVKPMFLVWPVMLLLRGYRRAGAVGLLAALAFGLAPMAAYGPGLYTQWLAVVHADAANRQVANASLPALLARLGVSGPVAVAAGVAAIVGVGTWVWLRRPSLASTSSLGLLAALIGSPLAWVGYGVFLLPVFARNWGAPAVVAAAVLLCVPRLVLQGWADSSPVLNATIGSAYSAAWLLLLRHELTQGDMD